MCGITGFIDFTRETGRDELQSIAEKMSNTLYHRGPDSGGVWIDPGSGIALGHRRLSIIDLSQAGNQPMISAGGRYVIIFNGEIYNHQEIRKELEHTISGQFWRGHSDTEIILAGVEEWGIEAAVKRFVGMFAFGLWDRKDQTLFLVRDRLGEKPLYYGWMRGGFLFGSELKALQAHPQWYGEISRDAVAMMMRQNYIPAPHSIYEGIYKLLPGTILTLSAASAAQRTSSVPKAYWSAKEVVKYGIENSYQGSEIDAINHLDALLRESVSQQMVADVPLGVFLSGGVDSSTIASLMQTQSSQPIKTFTIGFSETGYSEAKYAKAVASYLGTNHTEWYVTPEVALAVIPKLPTLYDEPFSDASQIPTFLVSQLAHQQVTVSLSGDGGDEIFGGYNRHLWVEQIWRKVENVPIPVKKMIFRLLKMVHPSQWDVFFRRIQLFLPRNLKQVNPTYKLFKLMEILEAPNLEELYSNTVSHWKNPSQLVKNSSESTNAITNLLSSTDLHDMTSKMMYADLVSYLPDNALVKLDRASMGVGLESRAPFLDHRIVEFALTLPLSFKIRKGQGKWILRQVLSKYIPKRLINRPKMGFGIPIDSWLRGPLREWAENLLGENKLQSQGFFNHKFIREKWDEHLAGTRNWEYHLWDVLMFQAWLENQRDEKNSLCDGVRLKA